MDSKEKNLMEMYGITSSVETIFHYDKYRYKSLMDAVNYAKIDMKKNTVNLAATDKAEPKKLS